MLGVGTLMGSSTYMLHGMGHTWHSIFVAEISHIDVQGGAGLVSLSIVDQQGFQVVLQADDAVVTVINRRFLEGIGQEHDRRVTTSLHGQGLRERHCIIATSPRRQKTSM